MKRKSKKPRRRASKSPVRSVRGEARRMLERGFVPIPVKRDSKRPIGKEWQKQRPSVADIDKLFPPGCNLGVLLGEPSRKLVDVDLDCPHAVAAFDSFMPPTGMATGRPGAPRSHRFYLVDGAVTKRFEAPGSQRAGERATLVELRSTGAQTLMPPSTHPSGEVVSYESDGEPAVVDAQELLSRVALVAITALLARLWPDEGKRHATSLAFAGFLLSESVDSDDVTQVVRLAAEQAGDSEVESRVKSVETTAKKLGEGKPVTGERKLIDLIGDDAVRQVRAWLRPGPAVVSGGSDTSDGKSRSRNTVDVLLRAVEGSLKPEVFSSNREPRAFVTVTTKSGRQTFPLPSDQFRFLLGTTARAELGRSVPPQAVDEVMEHLKGEAMFGGLFHDVHVRIAEVDQGRTIYVDLGGATSGVVEVTKNGWRLVGESPVRFVRTRSMLAMPEPVHGGDVGEIWKILNVRGKLSRTLLLAWLTSVFRVSIPCPILFVHGEQGAAKSTLTRFAHGLVDPSSTMLRPMPKDVHQLAIAAGDARVISMDNLSSIGRDTSDALCKLVTGASFPVRKFYSDSEERVFAGRRAMILNGIPDLAGFPDLAGRSLTLLLSRIDGAQRRTERVLDATFEEMRPRLLGSLLDVVSDGLRCEENSSAPLPSLERMADFCEWGCAVAPAIGSSADELLGFLEANRQQLNQQTRESSVIVEPVRRYLLNNRRVFEGTAEELLAGLDACEFIPSRYRLRREWPKSPSVLGRALRREADVIRDAGIRLELDLHDSGASPRRIIKMALSKRQKRQERQKRQKRQKRQNAGGSRDGTRRRS